MNSELIKVLIADSDCDNIGNQLLEQNKQDTKEGLEIVYKTTRRNEASVSDLSLYTCL